MARNLPMARVLQQRLPGTAVAGSLIYEAPLGRIVRGFYFEASSERDTRYVHCFVQPLYVPSEHLVLNMGGRIRTDAGHQSWRVADLDELTGKAEALRRSFLDGAQVPTSLAGWYERHAITPIDLHVRRAHLYTLVACERWEEASEGLAALIAEHEGDGRWIADVCREAAQLLPLVRDDRAAATELLLAWERATIIALRLGPG